METPNRDRLRAFAATLSPDFIATIPFNKRIFGVSNMNELVSRDQLMEVVDEKWLSASVINLWIRYICVSIGVSFNVISSTLIGNWYGFFEGTCTNMS